MFLAFILTKHLISYHIQVAGIFTKALPKEKFHYLRETLGITQCIKGECSNINVIVVFILVMFSFHVYVVGLMLVKYNIFIGSFQVLIIVRLKRENGLDWASWKKTHEVAFSCSQSIYVWKAFSSSSLIVLPPSVWQNFLQTKSSLSHLICQNYEALWRVMELI